MSSVVEHVPALTFHRRRGAVDHAFRYSVDYILLDPEDEAPRAPRLFARNRAGVMALHDSDHGGPRGQGRGAVWVREVLARYGLDRADGHILLLTQPRILGHWFNPVSFWLCHGRDGTLRAVIAEVNNTFGDRHSYLCVNADQSPITRSDTLCSGKIFHVSPFQKIAGGYRFRFDIRDDKIGVWIDFADQEEGLYATLTGPRAPLSTAAILRGLWRRPLGSRRVLALIHWHALLLFLKGAKYRARPAPPTEEIT